MNKFRHVILGCFIGSIITLSTTSFANPSNIISAILDSTIKFEINGEEQTLSSDYDVILYKDRTYVPVRFVAEHLGAEVDWAESTRTVVINEKECLPCSKEEKPQDSNNIRYDELPVTTYVNDHDLKIIVSSIVQEEERTLIFLELDNLGKAPIQLDQLATKFIIEDETIKQTELSDNILIKYDSGWFNDVREEQSRQGMITMPPLPKDTENITLQLKTIQNDGSQKETETKLNISL